MITYTVSSDQFNFITSESSRFTILSSASAFFGSAVVTCLISGLTVSGTWSAAQDTAFVVVPLFSIALALIFGYQARLAYKEYRDQIARIKKRSFAPGTLKTLQELQELEK